MTGWLPPPYRSLKKHHFRRRCCLSSFARNTAAEPTPPPLLRARDRAWHRRGALSAFPPLRTLCSRCLRGRSGSRPLRSGTHQDTGTFTTRCTPRASWKTSSTRLVRCGAVRGPARARSVLLRVEPTKKKCSDESFFVSTHRAPLALNYCCSDLKRTPLRSVASCVPCPPPPSPVRNVLCAP